MIIHMTIILTEHRHTYRPQGHRPEPLVHRHTESQTRETELVYRLH